MIPSSFEAIVLKCARKRKPYFVWYYSVCGWVTLMSPHADADAMRDAMKVVNAKPFSSTEIFPSPQIRPCFARMKHKYDVV